MEKTFVDGSTTTRHEYTLNGSQTVKETVFTGNTESYTLVYLYDEYGSPIGFRYRTPSYSANVYDGYFFEKNIQGDVIGIWNQNGTNVVTYTYDAWGNVTVSGTGATGIGAKNPFRYRGYYYDTETKLYYLQTRYYNPSWGRFISADGYLSTGIGLIGYNMFAYCNNNPVICSDPDGECLWPLIALVAVAATLLLTSCTNTSNSVGSAPNYVEIESSDGKRDSNPNCYSYALGYYDKSYDPGDFSTPFAGLTVDDVAKAVESDLNVLGRGCRQIESYNSPIQENEYRIALRVSKPVLIILPNGYKWDWDYHFMVQTSTGAWAEKHGSSGKTEIHTKGNPSTLVWGLGDGKEYYSGKILYYAITW